MEGGCSGAGEAVGGTPSYATVALQSLSSKLLSTLLSWPSTCEKLERWLVCLGTTLINRVVVGPKGGGGGAGLAWVLMLLVQSSEQLPAMPGELWLAI